MSFFPNDGKSNGCSGKFNKPPQQTESNTLFHDSPQKNVNQLNQNIIFKRQANHEYNNQSQHHVINTQY